MIAGHTPGPWDIVPLTAPKGSYMIAAKTVGREPLVCCVEHSKNGPINHDQAGKNARLIAAAPELLSELKAHQQALSMLLDALLIDAEGTCFNFKAGDGSLIAKITFSELQSRSVAAINKATRATP